MPLRKTDLETLLNTALALFGAQGYSSTSLEAIAAACGISKASLYHYFPSREALLLKVMAHLHQQLQAELFAVVADKNLPRAKRVQCLWTQLVAFFTPASQRVPAGCWLQEAAFKVPRAVPLVQACLTDWQQAIASLLMPRYPQPVAKRLALEMIAQLQGAAFLSSVWQDSTPTGQALNKMCDLLQEGQGALLLLIF